MRFTVFVAAVLMAVASAKILEGSVYQVDGVWTFTDRVDKNLPAFGYMNSVQNVTGWGILRIETNPSYSNEIQSYAAGLLEGILTENEIYIHSTNIYGEKKPNDHIQSILDENIEWEKQESVQGDARYWRHRKYLDLQVDGVYDGYMMANKDKPERAISKWQVQYANYDGDVGDWNALPHNNSEPIPQWEIDRLDHCSALVRMTDDKQDIIIGQNTWSALHTMFRIYKLYDIKLTEEDGKTLIPGHLSGFSTYPARISSGDDYYTVGDHMVVQETTIGNYNPDLYKYQNGKAVMQWARNIIANRLAESPKHWCELYAMYNNGCYANEWMVLDYDYFVPGYGLKKDGFWMIEQLPGYVHMDDMTDYLNEKGYFGSYNIAYFPDIWELGGTRKKWEQEGDDYSYEKCRRAQIYARDVPKVQDLSSFRAMLRYNDFRHDPLSKCDGYPGYTSAYTIACRNDLNLKNGTYPSPKFGQRNHASTDGKITSMKLLKERKAASQIISGPPYKNVGVFEWETSAFKDAPHWSLPARYEFPWIEVDAFGNYEVVGLEYDD